jgi:hypothetical protein
MNKNRQVAIIKGMLTNLFAMISPAAYMRLTGETGRGGDYNSGDGLKTYCLNVFDDYLRVIKSAGLESENFISNKIIAEYGPGDFLGVALLFLSHGAKRVYCIDRFPLKNDTNYSRLYNELINEYGQRASIHKTWDEILANDIIYVSAKDGIYDLPEKADLIVSRAVLEHCNDLSETFINMSQNLNNGGLMAHKADLTSHGTHLNEPLDFLCYSGIVWTMMTNQKGFPNRWRKNTYKELLAHHSFKINYEELLNEYSSSEVSKISPSLARCFRDLSDEDLMCSDYFFVAQKR